MGKRKSAPELFGILVYLTLPSESVPHNWL
jgi:hypothetical protein